ncbi:hypothetical protein AMTR_s00026p00241500, partial [Amborella trichopoda]
VPIASVLEVIKEKVMAKRMNQKIEKSVEMVGNVGEIKGPMEGVFISHCGPK